MTTEPSVTLVRRIKATPARVYAALTIPVQMTRWWRPDAGPVLSAEADVRVGGRFSVVFRTMDGAEHHSTGEYREVVPEERLVFTWRWASEPERESLVTIVLRPIGETTELTLIHALLADDTERDSHREGWSGALNKLEVLCQSSPGSGG